MRRSITILLPVCLLFILLPLPQVNAQGFPELNKYRYVLLAKGSFITPPKYAFREQFKNKIVDSLFLKLSNWYSIHDVHVIYDESGVLVNGTDACDILSLKCGTSLRVEHGHPYGSVTIVAQDCNGKQVFNESCEIDAVRTGYTEAFNGSLECIFDKYRLYHYKYTGQTQAISNVTTSQTTVAQTITTNTNQVNVEQPKTTTKAPVVSDVDLNIPFVSSSANKRFALIIGNEDYSSYQQGLNTEANVEYALHDADVFSQYAEKVLGIAKDNIIHLANATSRDMNRALDKLSLLAKATGGEGEIYFYYAGHGYPDELTKEAYLIPVDVEATELKYALRLKEVYQRLSEYQSKKVLVFLDACFSGGARNQGLLASRGIKIKPKEETLKGNMVVLSAVTSDQSSLPYKEKGHGIFTYFLLKALKDSKGDITLGKMAQNLQEEVSVKSILVNSKEQTPTVISAPALGESWKEWKIK